MMRPLLNNFFRGLFLVFPLGATLYIIYSAVVWSNSILNNLLYEWLNIDIPGLGILTRIIHDRLICGDLSFILSLVGSFDLFLEP